MKKSLLQRLGHFTVVLCTALTFVYILLPMLTGSCSLLQRMSSFLDESGIDPSRYYYTDVEQVKESEEYLRTILDNE